VILNEVEAENSLVFLKNSRGLPKDANKVL